MTRLMRSRSEDGNLVVAMLIIFVATAMIAAVTALAYNDLKTSRRYGDSANALQLADAAVNDAVKAVATAGGTTIGVPTPVTKTLGSAGSYTYTATLDPVATTWHIDAWGIDPSGVKRHVKADAAPQSLFSSAFFVDSRLALPSGVSLDSFTDGSSAANMCTRKGILGTNDPADLTFNSNGGNGNGQQNCTGLTLGSAWQYPVDGCVGYHNPENPAVWPPIGVNACPPQPNTTVAQPKFSIDAIPGPGGTPVNQQSGAGNGSQSWPQVPCDATHHIPGGATYFVSQVTLLPGCKVDAATGPAVVYTSGSVTVGIINGGAAQNRNLGMNAPDTSNAALCPTYNTTDAWGDPGNLYCSGWSSYLQIYIIDGPNVNINFGNAARFWGVIMGNSAQIATASQVEMWGALRVGGLVGGAQITLHYDEALGKITNGVYSIRNWREEPQ